MEQRQGGKEKQTAGEIIIQNRFIKWIDNIWYHYKTHILVVAFFILVGVVCFAQCSSGANGDLTISYAGGYTFGHSERENIIDVFDAIAPEKADKSRKLTVLLNDFSIYTEEELRTLYTDEDGVFSAAGYSTAKQINSDHLKNYGTYVMTGESAVWLVSEYVYDYQNLKEIAVPLSELFESRPESAYDDYAIRLCETELYAYYDALKVLPQDTLIVMPHSFAMWGEYSNEESYAEFLQLYRSILDFKKP